MDRRPGCHERDGSLILAVVATRAYLFGEVSMKMSMLVLMAVATLTAAPQSNVQVFKLATGETLAFPFQSGIPTPSESAWAFCRGAGPAFAPDGKDIRLNWVIDLRSKRSALRDVTAVKMQEVSGKEVLTLFTGTPKPTKDGLMIYAPGEIVTRSAYPWLYEPERTILVIRVELERPGEKPDVLLQPVLIGPDVKKQLQAAGYLR
jgi:hypothetical protein